MKYTDTELTNMSRFELLNLIEDNEWHIGIANWQTFCNHATFEMILEHARENNKKT